MNNIFLLLFLSVFLIVACDDEQTASPAETDTYIKFFGAEFADEAQMSQQTPDGGCILLGTTSIEDSDGNDIFKIKVIKVDDNGNQIWEKIYPQYKPDQSDYDTSLKGRSIIVLDDGYIVVGESIISDGTTPNKLLVMKLNDLELDDAPPTLNINHIDYGSQEESNLDLHGIDVIQDTDGNFRVISNVRKDGEIVGNWFNTINASSFSFDPNCFFGFDSNLTIVKSLHQTSSGNFMFGGHDFKDDNAFNNSILYGVASCPVNFQTGSHLSSDFTDNYPANQIIPTKTGYAVIGTRTTGAGNEIFFGLLEANGDRKPGSLKTFKDTYNTLPGIGTGDEEGLTIANTADGGFIIGGLTLSESKGEEDILLIKTDALGNIKWSKIHGNVNQEKATHIQQAADGGYLVFGNTEFGGINTMFLMKTDKNGDVH